MSGRRISSRAAIVGAFVVLCGFARAVVAAGPLLEAVKAGDTANARALLAERADANDADADGTTALHWAVHGNDVELVSLLLAAGANVAAANRYGVAPLYLASENGDAATVRVLLEHGADPNTALPEGETALMTAARTGDVATLEALLGAGADPNAREGWKGQTALMWAAAENNAAAVRTLLGAGAERDAASAGGELTAFTFAVRHGAIEATRALLDAGANVDATLADGTSLATGAFFLFGGSTYAGAHPADKSFSAGLASAAGGVAIKDADGNVIDSVGWGEATNAFVEGTAAAAPTIAPAPGKSDARHPNGQDTNVNSADFTIGDPTPGTSN